ncbi:MAG: DUF4097 domain-containing protein [Limosilactobacillus sp.]|jgi:hypothetical protein|uniref:DUF4097 family beta strand repeat-containing protein n=1 Tax=Limosilactobacillus sp. TaxID=2773925 RepID=UPI0025B9BDE0|nr:DUF4097 family beta strand repeat-containing protein [Limosilactobacillus sp.]MCI1974528.1 DUF4097 domain-containing protein [Limosilactobacillus sp.]MCI2030619.1 DUF4097 domain-containing protein [Limosilactobacillus sp.]
MKRMFKISLGILVVGIILMGIGFAGHGVKNVHFNGYTPEISHRITKQLSSHQEFSELDLNVPDANVMLKTGKKFSIRYQGTNTQAPKVKFAGKVATITQKYGHGTFFNRDDGDNTLVITVPKGTKISGKIEVVDGDLEINNVDLNGVDVNVADGNVIYNQLSVEGGRTTIGDGDFTSHRTVFKGHYTVKTADGDNKVIDSHADGFILHTVDGDNKLDGVDHGTEDLRQNDSAANLLRLEATDGDNSVINIKAVQ